MLLSIKKSIEQEHYNSIEKSIEANNVGKNMGHFMTMKFVLKKKCSRKSFKGSNV